MSHFCLIKKCADILTLKESRQIQRRETVCLYVWQEVGVIGKGRSLFLAYSGRGLRLPPPVCTCHHAPDIVHSEGVPNRALPREGLDKAMLLCPTWELLVREPPGLEGLPSLAGVQSRHLIHPVVSSSWRLGRDSREHGGGRPATALCSSGFHYVWQSLGLCVLEGSGLITHGGGSGFSLAVAVYTLENPLEWQGGKFCPCTGCCVRCLLCPPSPGLCAVLQPCHCLDIRGEASGCGRKTRVLAEEEAAAGN